MAQQTKADFKTTKNTVYADNTNQAITESSHRTIHENLADSVVFLSGEYIYLKRGASPVAVCSTVNVDISSGLASGSTIDGVTLSLGDRVLLVGQTDASENGIYVAPGSGQASRPQDFNTTDTVFLGSDIYVQQGTINAKTYWSLTAPTGTITVGTSNFTFELKSVVDTGERTASTSFTMTKKYTTFTGSSDATVTMPTATDWRSYYFFNDGTANVTFSGESFISYPGTRYQIIYDGTNWIFKG